jgi:hypothetical protein
LKAKFKLPPNIVEEIQKSLSYDNRMATNGVIEFVQSLTPQLRIAVTMSMYNRIFEKHIAFKELRNRRLLAFIGQSFRPNAYEAGQAIYK